jgi:DNA-nicking Smr family endonuclease
MRSKTGKRGQIRRLSADDNLLELFGEQHAEQPGPTDTATEESFSSLLEESITSVDQQEILSCKYPESDIPDAQARRISPGVVRAELDLHGCHVQEALVRVEAFIETCTLQGCDAVRIIVGKGLHSQAGAVLPDAVEKKIVELKRRGRVATFAWEKKYKRSSGSLFVYLA